MAEETTTTTSNTEGNVADTTTLVTDTKPADTTVKTDNKVDVKTDDKLVEYVDFKLPDGFKVDPESMTSFKTLAKEFNLKQEQAQKLVDMQSGLMSKYAKESTDAWDGVQKDWRSKAETDSEIGGQKFKENVGIAKKALDKYGTPAFKEAIEHTGMGNHPELIRFLYKVGKTISEDKVMTQGDASTGPKDPAKVLFPTMN